MQPILPLLLVAIALFASPSAPKRHIRGVDQIPVAGRAPYAAARDGSGIEILTRNTATGDPDVHKRVFHRAYTVTEDVAGVSATTVLRNAADAFFLPPAPPSDDSTWALVRLTPEGDHRVLNQLVMSGAVATGPPVDDGLVDTEIRVQADGWVRLTPYNPLRPGEYALIHVKRSDLKNTAAKTVTDTCADAVYDFVVAAAP